METYSRRLYLMVGYIAGFVVCFILIPVHSSDLPVIRDRDYVGDLPLVRDRDAAGVIVIEPLPDKVTDSMLDPLVCHDFRAERENAMETNPALNEMTQADKTRYLQCFTYSENLQFAAYRVAESLLGDNAPWFQKVKKENRWRIEKACEGFSKNTPKPDRAFDLCFKDRFTEAMLSHEERFRAESAVYINKRKHMAASLMNRCDKAINAQFKKLPKGIRLPLGGYPEDLSALPVKLLENGWPDDRWLQKKGKLKASDLMRDVLGDDCPGDMVLWVVYESIRYQG
ncbi:hypothetical protein CI610_00236 [invertebrate metagenome]|uniref:Uncharacterized protein n=1 Tax=invertebrate metagenome TaxID=1711999 RepID=A0A2H9TCA6_9ZZZZ